MAGQIRNGSSHTKNAVEGSGGKRKLLHSPQKNVLLRRRERAKPAQLLTTEPGIAGNSRFCKTLLLAAASCFHPGTDGGTAFAIGFTEQISRLYRGNFNNHIEAVQKRPGNFATIALDGSMIAAACVTGITQIAARTRVHGSHQHKCTGEIHAA